MRVKTLIVDDSPVVRQLVSQLLGCDPEIEILGAVGGGDEALEFLSRIAPDVITVDINMPVMDGFTLTRLIMESSRPCPVVIVSASWKPDEVAMTFKAVEAGAVAIMGTPHGPGHPRHEEEAKALLRMVKSMSQVKVVRRWPRGRLNPGTSRPGPDASAPGLQTKRPAPVRLVAMGASTGGPNVLQTILAGLPQPFPAPVLIVQHIVAGFLSGMANWLTETTGFPVGVAAHGQPALDRHAYLAPDGTHMGVDREGRIVLASGVPDSGLRPSISHLFKSVAESFGPKAAGVLLSGMGRDGAESLGLMKQKGALTIAQDQESSAVFGMPGEAVRLGAATYVLPPERIAALLAGAVANV